MRLGANGLIYMGVSNIIRPIVSHEKLLILLLPGIFWLIFLTLPVFLPRDLRNRVPVMRYCSRAFFG
jgi:hypothetical protein